MLVCASIVCAITAGFAPSILAVLCLVDPASKPCNAGLGNPTAHANGNVLKYIGAPPPLWEEEACTFTWFIGAMDDAITYPYPAVYPGPQLWGNYSNIVHTFDGECLQDYNAFTAPAGCPSGLHPIGTLIKVGSELTIIGLGVDRPANECPPDEPPPP